MKLSITALIATLAALATAAPVEVDVEERALWNPTTSGAYSALSAAHYASWSSSAKWAAAAYCGPTKLANWGCGASCNVVPGASSVQLLTAGGDNGDTPWYYVAKNSTHVVVGIRGTNTASLASWANNLGFAFTTPSSTYFPGSPGKVHAGFYETFGDMRADVLNAVRTAVNGGTKQVLVVGHSLGAAVANIMSVYLQKQVTGATVTARLFAPPRVGNPDWANYVDATLGARSQWMAIYDDLVPHLPTLVMNFRHSGNEAWMLNTNAPTVWRTCTGQENKYCSDSVSDDGAARITSAHGGPYAGVNMGC